jgi:two-component system NtrC family response regulator
VAAHGHPGPVQAGGDKPYVIKNCATLQKVRARSELFGYVKGSFTGATENREGLMTFANKGTMFLDEIGELPLEVQASLLRTLENKTYRRVGDKDERTTDIRLIFATNRNLAKEVEAGRFHEALYHRINVFNIELPPLRERKEDSSLLVDYFSGPTSRAGAPTASRTGPWAA